VYYVSDEDDSFIELIELIIRKFFTFLVGLTIYIRYRQIIHVIEHHEILQPLIGRLNKKALYAGLISCYGISIVANFQGKLLKILRI
jgi:hypothetical protein